MKVAYITALTMCSLSAGNYKPLMNAVIALKSTEVHDAQTQGLLELFGGTGNGERSRFGGIMQVGKRIYFNDFTRLFLHCHYMPEEQLRSLLDDLQKNKKGVWVQQIMVPRYGLTPFPLAKETIESYLHDCAEAAQQSVGGRAQALGILKEFLGKQQRAAQEAESHEKREAEDRLKRVNVALGK